MLKRRILDLILVGGAYGLCGFIGFWIVLGTILAVAFFHGANGGIRG